MALKIGLGLEPFQGHWTTKNALFSTETFRNRRQRSLLLFQKIRVLNDAFSIILWSKNAWIPNPNFGTIISGSTYANGITRGKKKFTPPSLFSIKLSRGSENFL